MYCNAFTDDLNPCLMSCPLGSDVCILHKDFYVREVWFERFIFSVDRILYYFSSSAKIQLLYKKSILDGRVPVTREHFEDLVSGSIEPSSLVDYYCLCCKQPGVDPFWNMTLFKATVKTILDLHKPRVYDMIASNRHTMYRFLEPLFTNVRFDTMVFTLLYYAVMFQEEDHGMHIDNKSVSMLQYLKDHPKFKTMLTQHCISEDNLICILKNATNIASTSSVRKKVQEFLSSLLTYRQRFRLYRELSCRDMKKELVEIVHQRPELFLDIDAYKRLIRAWPDYGRHVSKRAAERANLLQHQQSP